MFRDQETEEEDTQNEQPHTESRQYLSEGESISSLYSFYSEDKRHLALIPFCLPQDINKDFLRFGKVKQSNIHKNIRGFPGGSEW